MSITYLSCKEEERSRNRARDTVPRNSRTHCRPCSIKTLRGGANY